MLGAAARRHLAAFWLICMTADLDDSWRMQVAAPRTPVLGLIATTGGCGGHVGGEGCHGPTLAVAPRVFTWERSPVSGI